MNQNRDILPCIYNILGSCRHKDSAFAKESVSHGICHACGLYDNHIHSTSLDGIIGRMQFEQKLWVPHNFPGRPSWWPLLGSAEEIGELAHSFLKRAQGIRMSENHRAKMKDAVGDVVSFLVDFCEAEQFDFALAVRDAWNHAKQRDWKKYPEYGRPGGKIVAMSASPDDPVVQNGYEMGNFVVDESVGDKAANLDDQIEHDKRIGKPRG